MGNQDRGSRVVRASSCKSTVLARKHDRAGNLCQRIGEIVAFNRAIGIALKFAENEAGHAVLVTANRSHAGPRRSLTSAGEPASMFRIAARGQETRAWSDGKPAGPFAIARTLSLGRCDLTNREMSLAVKRLGVLRGRRG
jgi:hypothetical protein